MGKMRLSFINSDLLYRGMVDRKKQKVTTVKPALNDTDNRVISHTLGLHP
jgi:hypothetical protein